MHRYSYSIILFVLALTAIGAFLVPRLALNFVPQYGGRSLSISYSYADATPIIIEQEVTAPLEGYLARVRGIDEMTSVVSQGSGYTRITVEEEADVDLVRYEVSQLIRQLYGSLPDEVSYPMITVNDPDQKTITKTLMSYTLSAALERSVIGDYARDYIVPRLSTIEGVHEVSLSGVEDTEYWISYDYDRLASLGLSVTQLHEVIRRSQEHVSLSYARINDQTYQYLSMPPSDISTVMDMPVCAQDSSAHCFLMRDLVTLDRREAEPRRYYRINGENSIVISFESESDANQLATAELISGRVGELTPDLPPQYSLIKSYDSTEYIADELLKIKDRTLWSLGVLLLLVLISYRRVSSVSILMISLLANLAISAIAYYLLEVQLDLYALAGITVSFGIILDNSIVAAHHYRRHRDIRFSPALISSCATTLVALMVIFYLPERLQWELGGFAKVLTINLLVSLFIAIVFVPALLSRWSGGDDVSSVGVSYARRRRAARGINVYRRLVQLLQRRRRWVLLMTILLFGLPVYWMPRQVDGWTYYNKFIGSDTYHDEVRPWVNRLLGGSLRLFSQYVYEGSSYRSPEETILYVNARMPQGHTIDQMNELIQNIEYYLQQYDQKIKTFVTRVSSGQSAQIKISFPPNGDGSFPYVLKNRLQAAAIDLGGVTWSIYGVGRGFSNSGGGSPPRFRVMLKGYNKDELAEWSDQLAVILLEHPRVQEVDRSANIDWWEKDRDEYLIQTEPIAMARHDISPSALQTALQVYSSDATLVARTEDNKAIRTYDPTGSRDLWHLQNEQITTAEKQILFADVGTISKQKAPNSIHKENQQYLNMIEYEYTGSARFGQRYLDECLDRFSLMLPMGYTVEQHTRGWGRDQAKQYGMLGLIIIAIFFIVAIHFESLRMALMIVLLIPTSFIGVFLTFYWFDFPFDQGGYTSFLLVSGLVVNGLILLLSDYQHYRRQYPHRDRVSLYVRAMRHKITPIALSIISTALGLLPFTLHGSQEVFWFSLAVGAIGGLLFSMVMIVILPATYLRLISKNEVV